MKNWEEFKEKMWKVKARVTPEVFGALGAVTSKLGESSFREQHQTSMLREVQSQNQQLYAYNLQTPRPLVPGGYINIRGEYILKEGL